MSNVPLLAYGLVLRKRIMAVYSFLMLPSSRLDAPCGPRFGCKYFRLYRVNWSQPILVSGLVRTGPIMVRHNYDDLLIWLNSSWLGEIDIFEGVNLGTTNQYTAHTAPGCSISSEFHHSPNTHPSTRPLTSQSIVSQTDCGPSPSNTGCAFIDTNRASYGKALNDAGGAVIAMEWIPKGEIKICKLPCRVTPTTTNLTFRELPSKPRSSRHRCGNS